MDKTIEQQIAELTQEEKSNMRKIYKKYVICLFSLSLVIIAATAIAYFHFRSAELASMDPYNEYAVMKYYAVMAGGLTEAIGTIVIWAIFKKKYPYFSEKKYSYMKKHNL